LLGADAIRDHIADDATPSFDEHTNRDAKRTRAIESSRPIRPADATRTASLDERTR
jgi:hypothetical protein